MKQIHYLIIDNDKRIEKPLDIGCYICRVLASNRKSAIYQFSRSKLFTEGNYSAIPYKSQGFFTKRERILIESNIPSLNLPVHSLRSI